MPLEFLDNRHMKVARSSAKGIGHLYPQETPLVLNSVRGCVDHSAKQRPEGLRQGKIPPIRLEAQCLNQLRDRVPPALFGSLHNSVKIVILKLSVPECWATRIQVILFHLKNSVSRNRHGGLNDDLPLTYT
jgi:hypothetical protein